MKSVLIAIISLGLLFPGSLFAQTQDVTYLKKGDIAPYEGYIFTPQKELELRLIVKEHDILRQQYDLQSKIIDKLNLQLTYTNQLIEKEQQKAEVWRKASEDSTKKLLEVQQTQTYEKYLYFAGGIALMLASAWLVKATSK